MNFNTSYVSLAQVVAVQNLGPQELRVAFNYRDDQADQGGGGAIRRAGNDDSAATIH